MATKIAWCDETWNPIRSQRLDDGSLGWHCVKVSTECANCYSDAFNGRRLPNGGTGLPYTKASIPLQRPYLDMAVLGEPFAWRAPKRIFPCSMTDWCGEFLPVSYAHNLLAVASFLPRHDFLFLTKRAHRAAMIFTDRHLFADTGKAAGAVVAGASSVGNRPFRNCWVGFSAGTQELFDARWGYMRRIAEAGWFVWCSFEPLLGRIKLDLTGEHALLGWGVVGGESGTGARPTMLSDLKYVVDQFVEVDRPVFHKQTGSRPVGVAGSYRPRNPKGEDPDEWILPLRVRQYPNPSNRSSVA